MQILLHGALKTHPTYKSKNKNRTCKINIDNRTNLRYNKSKKDTYALGQSISCEFKTVC